MIDKKIYFLSGLPRTGSTLLGSILGQNPNIYVTPTSPLCPLLAHTDDKLCELNISHTFDTTSTHDRICHAIVGAYYATVKEPIIFDKHRWWPNTVEGIKTYLNPKPRIICTVRPITEIITSFMVLADKDKNNFVDKNLRELGESINNNSRARLLWHNYIKNDYESVLSGMSRHRENLIFVDYRDIVFHPEKTLKRIYDFCELEPFEHKKTNIENKCAEDKDDAWGMKNLHTIRSELKMKSASPSEYLPKDAIEYFSQFDLRVT